ncbi:hypothetical protein [Bacillus sp. BR3(2024)]|uniref:hypothetical protein n=1 Tax=Bacillus sp. BR3(2024) TaxID=3126755 RepID=UPI003182E4C1
MYNLYNIKHYPYDIYNPYLNHSSNNLYNNQRIDPIIQLRNNAYGGFYLDIDGSNGKVILSRRPGSGVNWKMDESDNFVTLQNRGRTQNFFNHFLSINPNTDIVSLSRCISNSIYWKMNRQGNIVTLKNSSNNKFLDIDGNTGAIMLSDQQYEGTKWTISTQ